MQRYLNGQIHLLSIKQQMSGMVFINSADTIFQKK